MAREHVFEPLYLSANRFALYAGIVIAIVVSLGATADTLLQKRLGPTTERFLWIFSLDADSAVPTWVAAILLLGAAVLLMVTAQLIASFDRRRASCWWLLSGTFCFLSLDEVAMLHEAGGVILSRLVPSVGELGGIFYFSWTLAAIPMVLLLGALLLRWYFVLPIRTRVMFGGAALLFLSGAIGLEMHNAWFAEIDAETGGRSANYLIGTVCEEVLEFTGVALFVYALIDHLELLGFRPSLTLQMKQ